MRSTSSSVRSRARTSGLMPVSARIAFERVRPMPYTYVSDTSMRLSFGISTPPILGMCLPLPLLVLRIFANHHDATVPADDLALIAAWFDGCSNFHRSPVLAAGPAYLKR